MQFDAEKKYGRVPLAYISKKGLVIKDPYDAESSIAIDQHGRQSFVDFNVGDALSEDKVFYRGDVIKITL